MTPPLLVRWRCKTTLSTFSTTVLCMISFGEGPDKCSHSQVRWRGKTILSTFSPTVLCMVAASVVLLASPGIAALAECQATESCGGTDDCRVCVDLTDSRTQCVSRDFCEWGKELQVPITAADIVFVVGGLVCELYTSYRLITYGAYGGNTFSTLGKVLFTLCFFADVGFTVGKLFPTSYLCRSLDCAKITHNCVMTLAGFFFAAFECYNLRKMAKESHEMSESQTLSTGMVKLLELVLCLAYVIYDVDTTETPGVGTTVLVVVACLAEVLLLCFEGYTVLKYEMGSAKVSPG